MLKKLISKNDFDINSDRYIFITKIFEIENSIDNIMKSKEINSIIDNVWDNFFTTDDFANLTKDKDCIKNNISQILSNVIENDEFKKLYKRNKLKIKAGIIAMLLGFMMAFIVGIFLFTLLILSQILNCRLCANILYGIKLTSIDIKILY